MPSYIKTQAFFLIFCVSTYALAVTTSLKNLASYICIDGIIDAATRTEDGSTYLFRDDFYWKIIKEGVAYDYPRLISSDWFGVHGPVDAAVTWNDGSTFLFKGDKYWRFYNKEADLGYPRQIKEGFPGIPNNIDAAVVWDANGKTYFFKGKYYWLFDQRLKIPVPIGYPFLISDHWLGVPNEVEAAIRWDGGKTYFFKHSGYYRYDEIENQVARGYPSSTTHDWFLCHNMTSDDIERERFGRMKAAAVTSNSCSCSCSQPASKGTPLDGGLGEELTVEMQSLKNSLQEVQKSMRMLFTKPERVRKEDIPETTELVFNMNQGMDIFDESESGDGLNDRVERLKEPTPTE